jgi:hypothetical protein
MGASKASISHLLIPSSSSPRNSNSNSNSNNLNSRVKLPISNTTRRLFLFTLPLPTFLLFPLQPTSYSALATFEPVTPAEKEASATVSRRVSEAVELLDKGRELQAQGDFNQALLYFTQVRKRKEFVGSLFSSNMITFLYKSFVFYLILSEIFVRLNN